MSAAVALEHVVSRPRLHRNARCSGRYNLTMYRTSGTTPATGWTPVVSLW